MTKQDPRAALAVRTPIGILVIGLTGSRRRAGRFADADEGGTQEAFVVDISGLKNTRHGPRPVAVVCDLETCFVPVRIERLADRIQPA